MRNKNTGKRARFMKFSSQNPKNNQENTEEGRLPIYIPVYLSE